jgi:hypothetical protein
MGLMTPCKWSHVQILLVHARYGKFCYHVMIAKIGYLKCVNFGMSMIRGEELGGYVPCLNMFKCEDKNNPQGIE